MTAPHQPGCPCVECLQSDLSKVKVMTDVLLTASPCGHLTQEAAGIFAALETVHARLELALGKDKARRIYMLALSESKKVTTSKVEFVQAFAQRHIDAGLRGEPI